MYFFVFVSMSFCLCVFVCFMCDGVFVCSCMSVCLYVIVYVCFFVIVLGFLFLCAYLRLLLSFAIYALSV